MNVQSLPLESAFYTVIWAFLPHKNVFSKAKISILYFKDALTHTLPTAFGKLETHPPNLEKLQFKESKI